MNPKDDGGLAFPVVVSDDSRTYSAGGMSLRDYFAAQAVNAWIASGAVGRIMSRDNVDSQEAHGRLAEGCYQLADAMLKERAK